MERYVRLEEISDGRLYGPNDMVRADCGGCEGCPASCCRGMGNTIVLDPLDVFRMTTALGAKFEELLIDKIELNVADGLILPNLKMDGEGESCVFLNSQGRCSIHDARPGICRIFPLGRYYEDRDFRYFLQTHECLKENRAKIKVATVYKGNIIKNLIMDCQSYTKYRPNETTGGIFVSWRRKEELPTGA
ncbi:YkgJ family cysteine cluster protein [Muricomes sp. OA1]|uniref:YkgJ family cysteine cluster protein n=1 Tax=Lachnospiraceae TaxID=186803 RepID=UPI001F068485|nr:MULTISPECIES: YkgJ family cysteine cluster protein [Clostridia]MCH1973398.1 YkgJ family cysteine cluster protein [Muricomes sp. OA1]GKH32254.1 hypothetical protein CE91St64_16610 [Faecalicatena contorta]